MSSSEGEAALGEALREILRRIWPADSLTHSLPDLWRELCGNEIPRLDAAAELAVVARELGRVGAAVPLIGAAVARRLLRGRPDAEPLLEAIENGSARVAVAFEKAELDSDEISSAGKLNGRLFAVEHWDLATHLLIVPEKGDEVWLVRNNADGLAATPTPGLAVPPLVELALAGVDADPFPLERAEAGRLLRLARILLIARAAGATRRGLELATDYVQVREQFGQTIGRFQALQHKLADCLVAVDVADLMIANAADSLDAGDAGFEVDALVAFASPALRRAMLELHHSFGAIGYSEEHELPRHFRRVHADTIRLGGAPGARLSLGSNLLDDAGAGFPELGGGETDGAFRDEVKAWLRDSWTEARRQGARARPYHERDVDPDFVREAGEKGWLAINWPEEHGGRGLTPLEQLAFVEETEKAGVPLNVSRAGSWIIAPALIRYGTDEQQAHYLPLIAAGALRFCLGYSEPQAGSDLASLRTSAVRDGDVYIVNGQKLWTTLAESATHVLLAARTDPDAKPKHAGISLFLVPTDSPGIQINPGMALYGRTFSTVFYDDVRVPAGNLLGPLHGGWPVLTSALASERVLMGGQVAKMRKLLENVVEALRAKGSDPIAADRIGGLAADLHAARLLSLRSVQLLERGAPAMIEGAISKLFSGDFAERLGETALELLGTEATFSEDTPGAPLDGAIEQHLRFSIMAVIGGGTAEIQRTLIAQRGLGLPR